MPPVIPRHKRERELFWVVALLARLPEMQERQPRAMICADDSNGGHDVVVEFGDGSATGAQVAEITFELERERQDRRSRFLADMVECFRERGLASERQVLVTCQLPYIRGKRYDPPRPDAVADATAAFIRGSNGRRIIEIESTRVSIQFVDEGSLYVPAHAGIGIDCTLDLLPRSLEMYCDAATAIRRKKTGSASPWLVIWSTSFCRDKHWLGPALIDHMRALFADVAFERVDFIESMDGPGYFEANLEVHSIKC